MNEQSDKNGISTLGSAAKALLTKAASTVFNPAVTPQAQAKPQGLNNIIQGIKPPDFSNRPIPTNLSKLNTSSYKPTIPKVNLPDFKSIIPSFKFDK